MLQQEKGKEGREIGDKLKLGLKRGGHLLEFDGLFILSLNQQRTAGWKTRTPLTWNSLEFGVYTPSQFFGTRISLADRTSTEYFWTRSIHLPLPKAISLSSPKRMSGVMLTRYGRGEILAP